MFKIHNLITAPDASNTRPATGYTGGGQCPRTPSTPHRRRPSPIAPSLERCACGAQDIVGFWKIKHGYEQFEPHNPEKPGIWRYADFSPLGFAATEIIPIEEADRRNLMFSNPGLPGSGSITRRLFGGVQIIPPGELSPVHRHMAAASRVMLEGDGAYTTVEGDKSRLERGDVVINPSGAWHETGNEGSEPIMWFDTLDLPFTKALNTNFFFNDYAEMEDGRPVAKRHQSIKPRIDWSATAYGVGGRAAGLGVAPGGTRHRIAALPLQIRPDAGIARAPARR